MIISASRRTDIPAFYADWFMNRLSAGFCTVPNPFNKRQVATISLAPTDVDVIVFWTRNPRPMMPYLGELDRRGFNYFFHYTMMGYPRYLDRHGPSLQSATETFLELSESIGAKRVIWRYDPITITPGTDIDFHLNNFQRIAALVKGHTYRCVISLVDIYRKTKGRLSKLEESGTTVVTKNTIPPEDLDTLMVGMCDIAAGHGLDLVSCAEEVDLSRYGVTPGKCIDEAYVLNTFGLDHSSKKDPGQRKACNCIVSKDIGMYDSCLMGCQYCYATSSFQRARNNYNRHDPNSPSLIGWYEPDEPVQGSLELRVFE